VELVQLQHRLTNEIDAADVTSPDLPAKSWSGGHNVRIKRPHSQRTLMLKRTALVDDKQRWQAATVPGYLGGRTFWLPVK